MEIFREGKIEVKIKRYKSSKKLRLLVSGSGEIKLTAPVRASTTIIEKFIRQNIDWIKKHSEETNNIRKLNLKTGEMVSILGIDYYLETKTLPSGRIKLYLDDISHKLLIFRNTSHSDAHVREQVRKQFMVIAKTEILERAHIRAKIMEVKFQKIAVREQKSRWGSCSTRGNLNFNWKLILAPVRVMDYVIVHELAHLKHPNHSRDFWEFVQIHHPSYKQDRNWLKENAMQLEVI